MQNSFILRRHTRDSIPTDLKYNYKEHLKMPKYFITWEVDPDKAPIDPKERGALWAGMVEMVKQEMKDGTTLDWGCFVSETMGYSVGDQNALDLAKNLQKYFPFVVFDVHQVLSVDDIGEVAKSLIG